MASLAGSGKAGEWRIDIDNEENAGQGYEWSVTIRHPVCCVQSALSSLESVLELCLHLSLDQSIGRLFQLGCSEEIEILIGIVERRLLLRMGRRRDLATMVFPWLLEVALDADAARDLVQALDEALRDARSA